MSKTASEYRTAIYDKRMPIYKVSALVGVHPSRLSQILNGHIPLSDSVAAKLDVVIADRTAEFDAANV